VTSPDPAPRILAVPTGLVVNDRAGRLAADFDRIVNPVATVGTP
jgi:hypothetical protein